MKEKLIKTLLMRAEGYTRDEVKEEYQTDGSGELVLTKRTVVEKYYPPDASALKACMELDGGGIEEYDDETLAREKQRLLGLLKQGENDIETVEKDKGSGR